MKNTKRFLMVYLDKQGNELTSYVYNAPNKATALSYAKLIQANSLMDGLHKIRVTAINRPQPFDKTGKIKTKNTQSVNIAKKLTI